MEPSSASCLESQSQGAVVGAGPAWKSCSSQGDGCLGTAFQSGRDRNDCGLGTTEQQLGLLILRGAPIQKGNLVEGWGLGNDSNN